MKLISMDFNEAELPETITVTLTIQEAAFLAKFVGGARVIDMNKVFDGGDKPGVEVYECLVGAVFNRYWDDGVDDYIEDRRTK